MAVTWKPGDYVEVAAREQLPADIKSQLYYPHFAGMRGTILKLYGEEASLLVDVDSLSAPVRTRHVENEKAQRQRWLDNLSEEGRNRLTAREKEFHLNYSILVSLKDILPAVAPDLPAAEAAPSKNAGAKMSAEAAEVVRRATESDIAAAEEAHLRKVAGKKA